MNEWFTVNRANWDDRAPIHAAREGSGYRVQRYIDDPNLLSSVVRFDLPLLGDITDARVVHLQCHIGTDTLSLARLGAASVIGLDFSPASVKEARELVAETGDAVDIVESDVRDALSVLPAGGFDLVYTGIGALCWLPSIVEWAGIVAALLAPGGTLHLREGHPILWAVDETIDDDIHLRLPYFETTEPLRWDSSATYVDSTEPLTSTTTYSWNHGIGEIVMALLGAGLRIEALVEHDSVPWPALPGQMVERPLEEWALDDRRAGVMPLSYTIRASKPV